MFMLSVFGETEIKIKIASFEKEEREGGQKNRGKRKCSQELFGLYF